ncbi:hypothetical protein H0H81_001570 [Sphagnurus paluster]|uniref:Apple domain-containing protein n=1 Tax=Sphagnurus paluster TaxID=117069 RepID=A0A9P7FSG0_9AGAR|nr:hypothetical protein H0H81_001570 [Sphagnurus paluster]
MRVATLLTTAALAASATATPLTIGINVQSILGVDLTAANHYGAPIPPWQRGTYPGWYYGNHPEKFPNLPCLTYNSLLCKLLQLLPFNWLHCPVKPTPPPPTTSTVIPPTTTPPTPTSSTAPTSPATTTSSLTPTPTPTPSDGYTQTFAGLNGATQADGYLTYGLVDTVAQCKAMCDSVAGCKFVNTYHDVNGKGGSTQLTCSLYSGCHTAADAINKGGQSQPDGSINYITDSDGYCKA